MKRWGSLGLLALALITGAALRLTHLERAPAGLDVDEAVNAWNAWCVAETGRDQHGVSWPIKETAGFGQGTTTRVPAAIAGVLTIALVYSIGAKLFDPGTGAVAALLLSVNPWHLQQSRWGHMSTMFPLAVAAVVASLLWAGFLGQCGAGSQPVRGRDSGRPSGGGRVENPSRIAC